MVDELGIQRNQELGLAGAKPRRRKFIVGKTIKAPFGGRGATLDISRAQRA
jgi:hypothetical protein